MTKKPIIYVPLFRAMNVSTNGTALSKSTIDLEVPSLSELVAQAEGIFVVALTENVASTDIEWNVAFVSGFDRNHENSAIDISATTFDSTMTYGVRSAEYTTETNFLLSTRLQVWVRNKAGISGVKAATLSAVLGIHIRQS